MRLIHKDYSIKSIEAEVLDKIKRQANGSTLNSTEIGGFIIGNCERVKTKSKNWIFNFFIRRYEIKVVEFIHCANCSVDKERNFQVDYKAYKSEVMRHFRESQGKNVVVGEWHSHPGRAPYPSPEDDIAIFKRLRFHKFYLLGILSLHDNLPDTYCFNFFVYRGKAKSFDVGYTWEKKSSIIMLK